MCGRLWRIALVSLVVCLLTGPAGLLQTAAAVPRQADAASVRGPAVVRGANVDGVYEGNFDEGLFQAEIRPGTTKVVVANTVTITIVGGQATFSSAFGYRYPLSPGSACEITETSTRTDAGAVVGNTVRFDQLVTRTQSEPSAACGFGATDTTNPNPGVSVYQISGEEISGRLGGLSFIASKSPFGGAGGQPSCPLARSTAASAAPSALMQCVKPPKPGKSRHVQWKIPKKAKSATVTVESLATDTVYDFYVHVAKPLRTPVTDAQANRLAKAWLYCLLFASSDGIGKADTPAGARLQRSSGAAACGALIALALRSVKGVDPSGRDAQAAARLSANGCKATIVALQGRKPRKKKHFSWTVAKNAPKPGVRTSCEPTESGWRLKIQARGKRKTLRSALGPNLQVRITRAASAPASAADEAIDVNFAFPKEAR